MSFSKINEFLLFISVVNLFLNDNFNNHPCSGHKSWFANSLFKMSNNLENDRNTATSKMYPIDLAPQKITIVKSGSSAEVKMAQFLSGQPKSTGTGQIASHSGPVGIMRPAAQILSPGVTSQPQMIVSGSPILQGAQIVSQSSQIVGQGSQIISQSQLISPGQMLNQATQIISQGSQLTAQASSANTPTGSVQASIASSLTGTQVLNVGGPLASGAGNLVVTSSVRTLPPSVRILPPLPHNTRPVQLSTAVQLTTVNVSTPSSMLMNKSVTSHVPRGLAAGASLAVRPVTPAVASQAVGSQGWSSGSRSVRGALVYGGGTRAPTPRAARALTPLSASPASAAAASSTATSIAPPPHSTITLPTTTVLTSNSIITGAVRGPAPRSTTPTPSGVPVATRPLQLLQRNYQPKVVGVGSMGVRAAVGNSAPAHLYYEVPRAALPTSHHAQLAHQPLQTSHQPLQATHQTHQTTHQTHQAALQTHLTTLQSHQTTLQSLQTTHPTHQSHQTSHQTIQSSQQTLQSSHQTLQTGHQTLQVAHQTHQSAHQLLQTHQTHQQVHITKPLAPYVHLQPQQVNIVNSVQTLSDARPLSASVQTSTLLPRPTILRKREVDGSPSKQATLGAPVVSSVANAVNALYSHEGTTGWEDVLPGGSGSTTESAASSPRDDDRLEPDVSPRKKPRKQILNNDVRQCEFPPEEPPPASPPPPINPPPKRPQLSSSFVCEWRATALHFVRPADVRRREPRKRDILAIASQKHVLTAAEGWKVHHLTAQMDDLVSLEADVGEQLAHLLRALENTSGRTNTALQPHVHTLLELIKGNIQRSKIVCEGIHEARDDILRVFTHRNVVSEILQRQADKRCFRKHRIQS